MQSSDRVGREQALRTAVLAGDERAWQTWYEESFDDLDAYVMGRCGGIRDRCDEVVQETWLIAVRRIRRFDPQLGSFAAWLRGIAANVLRNQRRRWGWLARFQPFREEPAADRSGEASLEEREKAERVAVALSALPERYEAVLRAKYLDAQSVAQIAQAWNETPKGIESLLTRARQAFRKAWPEWELEKHLPPL